jgi:hypothetical protein
MPSDLQNNQEESSPTKVALPSDKVTVIDIDAITPNSILVIKVDVPSPVHKTAVIPVFHKLLAPHSFKLREKNVTVMLMTSAETIEVVSEKEMNDAGWEKKAKSLILTPNKFR